MTVSSGRSIDVSRASSQCQIRLPESVHGDCSHETWGLKSKTTLLQSGSLDLQCLSESWIRSTSRKGVGSGSEILSQDISRIACHYWKDSFWNSRFPKLQINNLADFLTKSCPKSCVKGVNPEELDLAASVEIGSWKLSSLGSCVRLQLGEQQALWYLLFIFWLGSSKRLHLLHVPMHFLLAH